MHRRLTCTMVAALCLMMGARSLLAAEATVIHAVSLRGDPSTHHAAIGHLRKGSTVTLLAQEPTAGFYHVQTSDGTEGWVGVKYLSIAAAGAGAGGEPPPAGTAQPPASSPPATGTDTGCDATLWDHVYNPQRLIVHQDCVAVTGTIVDATNGREKDGVRHEKDGDTHGWLKLDPEFENLLNAGNQSDEGGNMVFEIVCKFRVTQQDAQGTPGCQGFQSQLSIPPIGSHVRMVGRYVQDTNHSRWNEIHPVTSITVIP